MSASRCRLLVLNHALGKGRRHCRQFLPHCLSLLVWRGIQRQQHQVAVGTFGEFISAIRLAAAQAEGQVNDFRPQLRRRMSVHQDMDTVLPYREDTDKLGVNALAQGHLDVGIGHCGVGPRSPGIPLGCLGRD